MQANRSRWAGRFIGATFLLGGIAWLIFALLVLGNILAGTGNFLLGPASSRIVAGGGAGTWFTMGILAYGLVAIVGTGLSALFYQYVEVGLGSPLKGGKAVGAWIHLLGGSGGAAAASLVMSWAGFWAGVAALPANLGGWGRPEIIHSEILGPVSLPIAILMGIALLGFLVGGIVLTTAWWATRKGASQAMER